MDRTPIFDKVGVQREFNNARARRALVDWYLSLFVMCKAWHQYNERLKALALLNSPQDSCFQNLSANPAQEPTQMMKLIFEKVFSLIVCLS